MENRDIEKAAMEYAEEYLVDICFMEGGLDKEDSMNLGYNAFKAGAQSSHSEIDELIEALEEAIRWVPVSERLPENYSRVFVKYNIANGTERIAVASYNDFWGGILPDFTIPGSTARNVTHWRPIDTPKATQLLEKYKTNKTESK